MFKVSLLYILLLFIACENDNKGPRTYKIYKNDSLDLRKENPKILSDDFKWSAPKSWNLKENTSSFRLASYDVPYLNSKADLSITKFPGDAGGIQANVNRWRKQLNLSELTLDQIESNAISGESNLGKYTIYKIINNKDAASAFLCMILQLKDYTIFVKLNTSIKGIELLESEFITFCSSLKPN